jgi:hypothetical protein
MKVLYALPVLALLGACVAAESPAPTPYRGPPPPRTYSTVGLERVMGQTARGLTTLFGAADAEVTEGASRKLQFGSRICVLDAYLYARGGTGEPVVTHVDARQRDGSAIDRASCVAALSRREGGK